MDDDVLLVSLKASAKNPDWYGFLDESFPGTTYAFVMRKDDKPFKELVDGVIADSMKSGEYAKIYAKWFESPIPPKNVKPELSHAREAAAAHQRPCGEANEVTPLSFRAALPSPPCVPAEVSEREKRGAGAGLKLAVNLDESGARRIMRVARRLFEIENWNEAGV